MCESEQTELDFTLEGFVPVPHGEAEREEVVPGNWRGRVSELEQEALGVFCAEAVAYARWEIGRYRRWRGIEEPALADGYDAEAVVQEAFQRLLKGERENVPILYSAAGIRQELQRLIKHRVNRLHRKKETRTGVSEWEVLPPTADGEQRSVFDYLAGRIPRPDEEVIRREETGLLKEFGRGFEGWLEPKEKLQEVFRRMWEGQKPREIAKEMGTKVSEVTNWEKQIGRRLVAFGEGARCGMREMIEGMKKIRNSNGAG